MQRFDALLAGALVLAAGLSAVGVWTYQDDRYATFDVTWTDLSEDVSFTRVTHIGVGEVEATLPVARANLTQMAFTFTLSGGAVRVQPTLVRVEVFSPENVSSSAEGEIPAGPTTSTELAIDIDLGETPAIARASAASIDGARAALRTTYATSAGVGTWRIVASFAPGSPGPLGAEPHALAGGATLSYYEADVTLVTPEVGR